MTGRPPLAYFFGDDDLTIDRAVRQFAASLAADGAPLERWDLRANRNLAPSQLGELQARVATPVLFGGGTLAVVANVGALTVTVEGRDAFLGLIPLVAPGNALIVVEAAPSGAKAPGQPKIAEAIRSAGGVVRQFESPREGALAAWIDGEARDRGVRLAGGSARELARRIGGFVREGDAERRDQTRRAAMELDKLALYRPDAPVTAEDVADLVAEAIPGSAWALADAVAERDEPRAMRALESVAETTPELVIVAILHRRIRELIEVLDRMRTANKAADIGRPMGIASAWRVERLVEQARRWEPAELIGALGGLLEVEAIVKGAPGRGGGEAQRRLAFTLWLADHVARAATPGRSRSDARAPVSS